MAIFTNQNVCLKVFALISHEISLYTKIFREEIYQYLRLLIERNAFSLSINRI